MMKQNMLCRMKFYLRILFLFLLVISIFAITYYYQRKEYRKYNKYTHNRRMVLLRNYSFVPLPLYPLTTKKSKLLIANYTSNTDYLKFVINLKKKIIKLIPDLYNHTIIVSMVDNSLESMALNFYHGSLKRLGLRNYILFCTNEDLTLKMQKVGLDCLTLPTILTGLGGSAGNFASHHYLLMSNLKLWIVIQCISRGHRILLSDLDIVFLKNPFPLFDWSHWDVQVMQDRADLNSGFMAINPTSNSISLFRLSWKLFCHFQLSHDQAYFNMAVRQMQQRPQNVSIKPLPAELFCNGHRYFEAGQRDFGPSLGVDKTTVVVHNNYLGSNAAKIYRFRETGMWFLEFPASARYLTYETIAYRGRQTYQFEWKTLKLAVYLSVISNRTLILPKFHCCDCRRKRCEATRFRCSLLSVLNVSRFDESLRSVLDYREHFFLASAKSPSDNETVVVSDQYADVPSYARLLRRHQSVPLLKFRSLSVLVAPAGRLATAVDHSVRCSSYSQWSDEALRFSRIL